MALRQKPARLWSRTGVPMGHDVPTQPPTIDQDTWPGLPWQPGGTRARQLGWGRARARDHVI